MKSTDSAQPAILALYVAAVAQLDVRTAVPDTVDPKAREGDEVLLLPLRQAVNGQDGVTGLLDDDATAGKARLLTREADKLNARLGIVHAVGGNGRMVRHLLNLQGRLAPCSGLRPFSEEELAQNGVERPDRNGQRPICDPTKTTHFFSDPIFSLRLVYCPFSVACLAISRGRRRVGDGTHNKPLQHPHRPVLLIHTCCDVREELRTFTPVGWSCFSTRVLSEIDTFLTWEFGQRYGREDERRCGEARQVAGEGGDSAWYCEERHVDTKCNLTHCFTKVVQLDFCLGFRRQR
jgi:hypothetical protein